MRSEKEILDALNVLQEVCECSTCIECILRNGNDECGVLENTNGERYDDLKEWCLKDMNKPRLILC